MQFGALLLLKGNDMKVCGTHAHEISRLHITETRASVPFLGSDIFACFELLSGEHVTRMRNLRNAYKTFGGKTKWKRLCPPPPNPVQLVKRGSFTRA
jgi:hypothetical protein